MSLFRSRLQLRLNVEMIRFITVHQSNNKVENVNLVTETDLWFVQEQHSKLPEKHFVIKKKFDESCLYWTVSSPLHKCFAKVLDARARKQILKQ